MLRILLLLAVFGVIHVVARADVVGQDGEHQPHADRKEAKADPPPPLAAPLAPGPAAEHKGDAESEPYQWHVLYAPAQVPNWFLVLAALVASYIANRTLNAIKAQADLMKLAYVQWITVKRWRSKVLPIYRPHLDAPWTNDIEIECSLVNESNFPLTLTFAEFRFRNREYSVDPKKYTATRVFLPPNLPYTLRLRIWISPRQAMQAAAIGEAIPIEVEGNLSYTGFLNEPGVHHLRGTLICTDKVTSFHAEPQEEEADSDES